MEQVELTGPWQAAKDAGAEVQLLSLKEGQIQGVNHMDKGDTFTVDRAVEGANAADYDGLVLPGGVANPDFLRANKDAVRFAREFFEQGKPVAAICHGPWTLVEAGVVRGRTLTSWPSLQTDIRNAGGTWVDQQVHVDKGLVTSRKPDDIPAFNAGVGVGGDFARGTDLRDELTLIALNVVSPVHLAKRALPDMVGRGRGRVLFTSSIAATMPAPFEAVYGASKAFLLSFAEALRNELKDTGVTVTALMPGPTDTNFFHRAGMDDTKAGAGKKDDPAEVARQGFEALMAGKDHVVAGSLKTKLMGAANEALPETAKAEAHRHLAEPGSAGK